ncbi:hypothetical protein OH76DRAFT_1562322 [Lentinus brumalis]|uniref:Uncharacterized protein n=1 Tax=Lentinus brumalis TaxID=2498619 RepID=A0A371CHM5_9APHY|nr:hypothetical protein OH76DRAFT_1562322 [Polyporus brumalis]
MRKPRGPAGDRPDVMCEATSASSLDARSLARVSIDCIDGSLGLGAARGAEAVRRCSPGLNSGSLGMRAPEGIVSVTASPSLSWKMHTRTRSPYIGTWNMLRDSARSIVATQENLEAPAAAAEHARVATDAEQRVGPAAGGEHVVRLSSDEESSNREAGRDIQVRPLGSPSLVAW